MAVGALAVVIGCPVEVIGAPDANAEIVDVEIVVALIVLQYCMTAARGI